MKHEVKSTHIITLEYDIEKTVIVDALRLYINKFEKVEDAKEIFDSLTR